jgi:integrase/recombinase XerD
MTHDPLIVFQRHLEAQGKRPGTQDSYVGILARFLRQVALPPESITAQHVYDHLIERGTAPGLSRSWYNVIYHALVSWLEMRGLSADLRGLCPKRIHQHPVRWFRADEANPLLAGIEDLRYRTFFLTMLGTGMRIGAVRMLRVADVDRERPLIQVREGKGGDGRYVRCEPTLRRILRAHWQRWRPTDLLFPRRLQSPGAPLEQATLNAALRRSAERCGLAGQVSSHRLRHTFAMHSLQGGMDVVALSRLMGHRCLQSTVRYVTPDLVRPVVAVDVLAVLGVQS